MHPGSGTALAEDVPPGTEEDLARRLARVGPGDTARGVLLRATLEVVRAVQGEVAARHCQEAAGEEKLVDFFNYPVGAQLQVLFRAAWLLREHHGSLEEALRRLGRHTADSFLSSAAGKTLQFLSGGEAMRLVGHLPSVYRSAVSFGERSVVWTGPRGCRLVMNHDLLPVPFHEGVLLGVLEKARLEGVRVLGTQLSMLDSTYDISWDF